jgi:hypothetical protein
MIPSSGPPRSRRSRGSTDGCRRLRRLLSCLFSWGLTFELSGSRRQATRPGPVKMYRVPPAWAWGPAVGAPLERGVRPRYCCAAIVGHAPPVTSCCTRVRNSDAEGPPNTACRALLQYQHAATILLRLFVPRSLRATRCSAVATRSATLVRRAALTSVGERGVNSLQPQ